MDKESSPEINPQKEKIAKNINNIRQLKDQWKDEIPSEVIYGGQEDKRKQMYKCRKNWWAMLVVELEYGTLPLLDIEKDSDLIQKIKIFFDDYCGTEFQGSTGRLTTEQDIQRANSLIEEIIGVLENVQSNI